MSDRPSSVFLHPSSILGKHAMTAFPQYTPVGTLRHPMYERHVLAAAALSPGDFYAQADGLIGAYAGLESASANDPVVFYMEGVFDVLCAATTDTYAAGAAVYFDTVNKYAVTTGSATCLYMGTAEVAKLSGAKTVRVILNGNIAPSLAGAATATTLTVSGATTLSAAASVGTTLGVAGATTLTGALTANGGIVMGGSFKASATNTPVAAAGSTYANAAALGAQDVMTITSDSAAKGVKLPTGVLGMIKRVINTTATACNLYAATGGTLSGLAANAPVTIAASHIVVCYCVASDTWYVEDAGAILAA
jgi:predicted RecA/RadA family phage recombinase